VRVGRPVRWLERVNPVTLFLSALLYTVAMLVTLDRVSALVALSCWLPLLALAGVTPAQLVRRSWPLFVAAPLSALSMLLYAEPAGRQYGSFWLARVTDNSLELALAVGLRVLAVGVPTLTLLVGIDPTRLADGLAQVVRLPSRFVLGALAGLRLFAVFTDDWRALTEARRARGLGDSGAPRRFLTMSFALLVIAIRRAGVLATAMEARGFGSGERTWARPSTVDWRDAVVVLVALAVATTALTVSALTGSFRLVGT